MGCLCMTNNNLVIKSKDIILNDEIKKDNHNEDINNDINILITKNSENMPKVENKSLEKPTKINKEKIKKERSINSQSNIFNSKLKNKFNNPYLNKKCFNYIIFQLIIMNNIGVVYITFFDISIFIFIKSLIMNIKIIFIVCDNDIISCN